MFYCTDTMKQINEISKILTQIDDVELMDTFLEDLLTPQEMEELCKRWALIKLVADGKPQREIAKTLKISIGTVSRGAKGYKYGNGGFQKILEKIKNLEITSE